ncbi:MFS transporter, partial [Gilvimarinus sp. 1_MG-2023]|nr:MFS transporter [Gilvimarinus sp. 1_MG-2023]
LMVAIFVAIPLQLSNLDLPPEHHSYLYLPVLILAFGLMIPLIIIAEKRRQMKNVVLIAAALILLALLLMIQAVSLWHWA